ncbi:MAG TPA: DUF3140 domain-containing protein [Nocardioidaceae bacterium]|nr:DUF3140 domain-containing protein [Nocardioidaceae bacterium]
MSPVERVRSHIEGSGEETEGLPDQAGRSLGRRVLHILGKRNEDLTPDDVDAMTKVVDVVHRERRDDLEPPAAAQAALVAGSPISDIMSTNAGLKITCCVWAVFRGPGSRVQRDTS